MSNEPIATNSIPESEKLDLEKRRLECEKLRAEIGQVTLAWWKRPGYIGGLAPIILALVGFSSAWIGGYFETQRTNLANEIKFLGLERDRSNGTNEEIQRRIDDAYLRLKNASGEATYAIGHIRGLGPPPKDARAMIEAALDKVPSDVAEALVDIFHRYDFTDEIVEITENELNGLNDTLKGIPASEWAIKLRYHPMAASENSLIAPDGRYYHLDDRRYYNLEEL